jgi:hypothetical protein
LSEESFHPPSVPARRALRNIARSQPHQTRESQHLQDRGNYNYLKKADEVNESQLISY